MQEENFQQEEIKKSKSSWSKIILISVIILLVLTNIATAGFWYYFNYVNDVDDNKVVINDTEDKQDLDIDEDEEEQEIDLKSGEILIDWNEWLVKEQSWSIFDFKEINDIVQTDRDLKSEKITADSFVKGFNVYKAGLIIEGPYTDKELLIITASSFGMPGDDSIYRVIKDENNLIVLDKYSDRRYGAYEQLFVLNEDITIANIETPEIIKIPDSKFVLKKAEREPFKFLESYSDAKKMFKYNDVDYLYKSAKNNCFIVRAPDGTVREYYFELDFLGKKGEGEYHGTTPNLLDIEWSDGTQNENEYIFKPTGGCGAASYCYNYPDYIKDKSELESVAGSPRGDIFYIALDQSLKIRESSKISILEDMHETYYPGYNSETNQPNEKESFEKFLATRPIIYWQDPFGDFMEFRNAMYISMAECGKPVIYLYPETEMDISVYVNPTGGFSVTEPEYNGGWKVKAKPNGEIYNYSDQKIYPYLFWEGFGMDYKIPEKGFVVAKDNVESFLTEKLAQLGLIEKEYDEFLEYWLPRMQEDNYYFITFVPQKQFDGLAPLNIIPNPDTVIRVFMDYQGLDEYIEVEPQDIITPVRDGFTVVEWGGAIHR